jgi:hypothetical protein
VCLSGTRCRRHTQCVPMTHERSWRFICTQNHGERGWCPLPDTHSQSSNALIVNNILMLQTQRTRSSLPSSCCFPSQQVKLCPRQRRHCRAHRYRVLPARTVCPLCPWTNQQSNHRTPNTSGSSRQSSQGPDACRRRRKAFRLKTRQHGNHWAYNIRGYLDHAVALDHSERGEQGLADRNSCHSPSAADTYVAAASAQAQQLRPRILSDSLHHILLSLQPSPHPKQYKMAVDNEKTTRRTCSCCCCTRCCCCCCCFTGGDNTCCGLGGCCGCCGCCGCAWPGICGIIICCCCCCRVHTPHSKE